MQRNFLVLAAVFYVLPLIKFLYFISRHFLGVLISASQKIMSRSNRSQEPVSFFYNALAFIAEVEYYFQFFRFLCVGVPVILWWLVSTITLLTGHHGSLGVPSYIGLFFLAMLVFWHAGQKKMADLRASQLIVMFPDIHPGIFFRKYKFELTYGGIDFFHSDPSDQAWASHMDYRKGRRAQQKKTLFVKAVFDMAYVAHICLSGLKYLGPSYLRAFADQLIAVLGKRLLQLSESSLSVLGAEKLQGLQGKFILIFNHKSAFDFALTPYVLSHITVNNRRVRPRFILAQDHFKDNWFLYHVIGMGKAAEAIDMIFVSRKDQKKSFDNLKQAAQTMIEKDVDIAIYPQGTRAAGNYDRADKRRDAGYYTTVRKKDLNSKWPHLKRGTAFLALDVLTQLRVSGDDQELHLVFIGISGTATVLPKGSLAVQTEAEVVFTIGDVLSLSPHMLDDLFVADQPREEAPLARKKFATELTGVINEKLLSVLNLKFQLLQRFLTELKGQFHYDNERLQVVQNNMVMIDKSSDVVFEILDKIYSLPVSQWNGYLSQLSQMLLGKPDLTRFEILAHDVTEDLLSLKAK